MTQIGPTNVELAEALEQMAELLVRRGEHNPYRVQAYLQAAGTIRALDVPVATIYGDGGKDALTSLPGVGVSLAGHLAQYVESGRIGLRDRLLAASDPVALLETLPSVGHRLAVRLVDDMGIRSLAELERAAHDGRLAAMPGVGPRTVEAIRLQLNSILNRSARRRARRVNRQVAQMMASERYEAHPLPADADRPVPEVDRPAERPQATIYSLFPPAAA
ncbi:MAG TPA: helix-hairpin-helix domain-containing protein [Rubricoccaceae bacterium]|jgi:DNA polymerase/3'-5' exonuclease PolX